MKLQAQIVEENQKSNEETTKNNKAMRSLTKWTLGVAIVAAVIPLIELLISLIPS